MKSKMMLAVIMVGLFVFASCDGSSGEGSSKESLSPEVRLSRTLTATDGPISGAVVFLDKNGDYANGGEPSGATGRDGRVTISIASDEIGAWWVNGRGKDEDTNMLLDYFMGAPFASEFISPLTTYLALGMTPAEVNTLFGGGAYNLFITNPNDHLDLYKAGVKADFVARALAQLPNYNLKNSILAIARGWLTSTSEAEFVTFCAVTGFAKANAQVFAKVMTDCLLELNNAGTFNNVWFVQKTIQDEVIGALSAFGANPVNGGALISSYSGVALHNLIYGLGASNQTPFVVNQIVGVKENLASTIWLKAEDSDGAVSGYTVTVGAAHGTVQLVNAFTGEVLYTPNQNYLGQDVFVFRAKDNLGAWSNSASVVITVSTGVINQTPVAEDKAVDAKQNQPLTITLIANDPDGSISGYTITTMPAHGAIQLNKVTGEVVYTPSQNYFGLDSFVFRAKDNLNVLSSTALVSITVKEVIVDEVSLKVQVSAAGRSITYVPMNFASLVMEAGAWDSNTVLGQPILMPKIVVVKPGEYQLIFTFRDSSGQYLTGGGELIQNWDFEVKILGTQNQVLLGLNQSSGWTWVTNNSGGGNLRINIKINPNGTLQKV